MITRVQYLILGSLLLISSCALPRPANVERQDFIPQNEILLSSIVRKAQEDYARGRLFDAELRLRQALLLAPGTTQVLLNLGRTLARNGQITEAQQAFAEVLKRKENDAALLNFVGESFFEAGEYWRAQEYFVRARDVVEEAMEKVVFIEPDVVDRTYHNISTSEFRAGNVMESLCALGEAFKYRPSPDNVIRIARNELAIGDYANAESRLSTFLTLTPGLNDARVYLMRAIARLALGQKDKAIEDIKAALKRDDTIAEFSFEYKMMSDVLIVPEAVEGEDVVVEEDDEDAPIEYLSVNQRLYMPSVVSQLLDDYAHQKEAEREE